MNQGNHKDFADKVSRYLQQVMGGQSARYLAKVLRSTEDEIRVTLDDLIERGYVSKGRGNSDFYYSAIGINASGQQLAERRGFITRLINKKPGLLTRQLIKALLASPLKEFSSGQTVSRDLTQLQIKGLIENRRGRPAVWHPVASRSKPNQEKTKGDAADRSNPRSGPQVPTQTEQAKWFVFPKDTLISVYTVKQFEGVRARGDLEEGDLCLLALPFKTEMAMPVRRVELKAVPLDKLGEE